MSDIVSPAPALLTLRDAIDAHWPDRNKASDGILGDAAHQARVSDHNQGNALDITYDPEHGPDLDGLADVLMADERTHYVIWKARIRNLAIEGGAWRPYNGPSPHTEHLHLSIVPERREDVAAWRLPADPAPTTEAPEAPTAQEPSSLHAALLVAGLGIVLAIGVFLHAAAPLARAPHREPRTA